MDWPGCSTSEHLGEPDGELGWVRRITDVVARKIDHRGAELVG
jgi:hypothetical protein